MQSNTLSDSPPVYLYRAKNNQWWVGSFLGKRKGWLKNSTDSVSVPETGWEVADGKGGWLEDPQLTARCGPLTESAACNSPSAQKRLGQSGCLVYKTLS